MNCGSHRMFGGFVCGLHLLPQAETPQGRAVSPPQTGTLFLSLLLPGPLPGEEGYCSQFLK